MRIVLATVCFAATFIVDAKPVHVDFMVRQTDSYGDTPSGVYQGTWSFDDSIVKPNGLFEEAFKGGKLKSFTFAWLGEEWHPGNVRLARLEFDAKGELRSWIIGATVVSGGCNAVGALDCVGVPADVTDFYLVATRPERGVRTPPLVAVGVQRGRDKVVEAHGEFTVRRAGVPRAAKDANASKDAEDAQAAE